MADRLPMPNPAHQITVTRTVFGRTWFECGCGLERQYPSKRAAVRRALQHWQVHHAYLLPSDFRPVVDTEDAARNAGSTA